MKSQFTAFVLGSLMAATTVSFAEQATRAAEKPVPPKLTAAPAGGTTFGTLRVELTVDRAGGDAGVLSVFMKGNAKALQRIPVSLYAPYEELRLEFVDLDKDEAQDLIFMNQLNGANQAFHDVYLWNPSLSRFEKNERLSGRGEVYPNQRGGCITISSVCNARTGYYEETLCKQPGSSEWRLMGKPRKWQCN